MVRMNKVLRSSQDFEKKQETPLTNSSKFDLTAGLADAKPKHGESKGLILPGTTNQALEEELVDPNDLLLSDTISLENLPADQEESPDVQLYRAMAGSIRNLMDNTAVLDITLIADHAYKIIEGIRTGPGLLRLAMRPSYLEAFIGAHSVNIAILSGLLTQALKFDEQQQLRTVVGALVHDIGMSRLPPDILQNQRELTPEEKEELRRHPGYGAQIIREQLGENYEWLARVALQEHERAQGQGYPNGLMVEYIDPCAQIIGMLDVFEAFTHPRRQHEAASPSRIIRQIIESKDQLFSPIMIKALLQAVSVYPIETYVLLNNGQTGRVIATNPKSPLRPWIELHTDHNQKALSQLKNINLSETPVLSIIRALEPDEVKALPGEL